MIKALLISLLTATLAHGQYDARTADYLRAWRIGAANQIDPIWNGLVAYWSMDSVSGKTVFDKFGDNDATAVNSPLFGSEYGKHLDGMSTSSNSLSHLSADSAWSGGDVTINFWLYVDEVNEYPRLFFTGDTATTNGLRLLRDGGNLELRSTIDGVAQARKRAPFSLDTWIMVTFGVSGGVPFLVTDVTNTASDGSGTLNAGALTVTMIGRHAAGTNPVVSYFDEVAIWNRALSSNEVSELYNNGAGKFYTP